ncbi:MAG TPA: sigma 54-interacting transcriptional regulator [Pyrinomonadaceae bacterium]|jgi:Nif-specific regulatory protein|nr:sigma 54-interacting transcriptional regulator [Pyrinomonadaceae bacterium]
MKPRLASITGKLKDTVIPMTEGPVLIGRQTGANLRIRNAAVSRRHAMIEKEGDSYVIADLDSRNGTFVNNIPVKRCELHHGDRVQIGESEFFFLLEETEEPGQTSEIRFDEVSLLGGPAVRMTYSDALYVMARDLSAFLKISTTINAIRGLDKLQRALLELLFEVVPARRGAILLTANNADSPDEFSSMFGLDRHGGTSQTVTVSRTIVRRVLSDRAAIMLTEPDNSADLKTVSLIAAQSRSVLCVPLIMLERVLGAIYLDTDDPVAKFDENHLQLLTAVAAISAVAIENARNFERLQSENARLLSDADIEHNMIGESPLLQKVYQLISKVAPTDSTVLISGESGTGKELAARAIHRNSKRADKPFIAVNCAALAESLLESELFGHEKGAFTGAVVQKKGRLELADSGTIFLDEIGDLSPGLQTKLLRVLQEREFERVGGNRTIKIDVRLLAATNRDLEDAIVRGSFRRDLYFRLNVVNLKMPALRERREDIPLLANYFARKYGDKCNRVVFGISPEARRLLANYDWPGNVRELENAIERAIVLGPTDHILPDDLPEAVVEFRANAASESGSNYHEQVVQMKKKMIIDAVKQANGNYTAAARLLNLHPNYLHRLIRNLNLKDELGR